MKKSIALVFALVCALSLIGCSTSGKTDFIELGEVSAFVSEKGYTAEDFEEKLIGQFHEDIIRSWGETDIQLSGFWGGSWYLDDNNDRYIALYYDANGYVEDIVIGTNKEETAGSTIETEQSQPADMEAASGTVSRAGTEESYELTAEETAAIFDILHNGNWAGDLTKCESDYVMTTADGDAFYYHSACGTFNDNVNNRSLSVTDREKESIQAVLDQYIILGAEQS